MARGGFSMGDVAAHSIVNPDLLQQPGFKETYAAFETRPRIGDMFQNTDLAATLHQVLPASAVWHALPANSSSLLSFQIAVHGSSAFYRRGAGSIASAL